MKIKINYHKWLLGQPPYDQKTQDKQARKSGEKIGKRMAQNIEKAILKVFK